MILFKTAWNDFKKNIIMNIFIIVQVTVCLVLTAVMVSTISIRSQYYTPFKDLLTSNGIFLKFTSFPNYDQTQMNIFDFLDNDAILKECPDADNVYSCYNLFGQIDSFDPGESHMFQTYDDAWIERYQPEMTEGKWLSDSVSSDQIEVVVSENDYGIDVGDEISFTAYNFPESVVFTGKVVGKFKDNAKIIGWHLYNYGSTDMNFNNLYYPFNHQIEGQIAVLASHTAIQNIGKDVKLQFDVDPAVQPIWSNVIITYPDDVSKEQIELDKNKLLQYGYANAVSLDEMDRNSKDYIMKEANMFLPIIVLLLVLAAVSVISSSALIARKSLNNYALYYVCGLQWKHCSVVNLLHSLISTVTSVILGLAVLIMIPHFTDSVQIIWSKYIVLSFTALILLQLMISMIMPMIIIGKNTPKQILTR